MKVLITSHSDFCQGILNSYQMIAGKNPQLLVVSLDETGIQNFRERFVQQLAAIESETVLILTDIKGGTPYNEAYSYYLAHKHRVRVVAGMNLPMLIEVGMNLSGKNLTDLYTLALVAGQQGISGVASEAAQENDVEF